MGWNCGPHINFCSIIFFLMRYVRKFPHPETMCCEVWPLLPLPIMQTVASVPCLLPLVYAKRSFCMGKGEDLNEEFFAVTDERFLIRQKPSLLICWDLCQSHAKCFDFCRCTDTGGMRPLLLQHRTINFKVLAKSVNCLFARSPPCIKVCMKISLSHHYTLLFLHKTIQLSPVDLQSPVVRHFTNWCVGFQFWLFLTSITFSMNYSIHSHVCNIDTVMLQF